MNDFGARFALYWPALLDGALTTLWLCLAGMLLGFVLGVLIYLLGNSRSRGCVAFARVYVSFFRGTPMLAQLLLLFYLPAGLGLDVPALVAAGLALAMNTAPTSRRFCAAVSPPSRPGNWKPRRCSASAAGACCCISSCRRCCA
ncbi:ABC transporter permease subunit [Pseudomonas sp. MDMC_285]|nr:ABC transporter permease subunit [Pseudomonas sp. MDMC_285]